MDAVMNNPVNNPLMNNPLNNPVMNNPLNNPVIHSAGWGEGEIVDRS